MPKHPAAFEKRLKRRVAGRIQTFFVSTAPGFEKLCLEALTAMRPELNHVEMINGGVVFKGKLVDCYLANLMLRTANRILMRIDHFKATNFRQLEKKLDDMPWELYLPKGVTPDVNVTTRHSRLYHKKAIAERFQKSVVRRLSETYPRLDTQKEMICPFQVFVRADEDRFTVSIDSSGENLYKRGIKSHGGRAPLRETIAAAALTRAGDSGREPLYDPMC